MEQNEFTEGMAKAWAPQTEEPLLYEAWRTSGLFAPAEGDGPTYCITTPPPNITGSLHMGHAINHSIQDALIRWKRMRGFRALGLPGADHAGIATQAVVERALEAEGTSRVELGREKFIERCRQWREQYGARIYHQMERMGCSYDWSRARYTMDESYVDAILTEFESWYRRGWIYRGARVVNWDVQYRSAVSDIEVFTEPREGSLYHFRYPFADGSGSVTIATTRPETMLGDTAVAANPDDPRYRPLFGRLIRLPLTDRDIPLIADAYARPEFGSGAVKVTPAHDLDDFECGLRHDLAQITVIGPDGRMTDAAGQEFAGLDRFEARSRVVEQMRQLGLLEKTEPYTIQTPISDRSGVVVEPLLSEQWFVDMKELAGPAIEAVRQAKVRFVPERYAAICLQWLENIRPWCISRQLWWGHRIPVWWTLEGGRRHTFARSRAAAEEALGTQDVWQDEDVLDTWFSSGIWPQATLGWPSDTADLRAFYPTDLLSTAQEILYLWVARMMMSGLNLVHRPEGAVKEEESLPAPDGTRGVIPFRRVYVHATVLDARGQRMSKSKGNGIDPLDLVDRFGADAVRLGLLHQAGMNQDIRFGEANVESARNFCTKLWNAARFILVRPDSGPAAAPSREPAQIEDRWIRSRLAGCLQAVDENLESCNLDDAVRAFWKFLWNDYCDWYLEIIKPRMREVGAEAETARAEALSVLRASLCMMHPFIPFVTEAIWQHLREAAPQAAEMPALLAQASWPAAGEFQIDPEAELVMESALDTIRAIRNMRSELGIAPGARLRAAIVPLGAAEGVRLEVCARFIRPLARLEDFVVSATSPQSGGDGWSSIPVKAGEVFVETAGGVDLAKEQARIGRELEEAEREIARCEGMLANANFVERAKPEVVQTERDRLAAWMLKREKLELQRTGHST
ncbi:MAG: valine--tRNA ligase [Armatimonadetes bacterium]|nr:valine--tRNA ligase [Armatimonadota bacterium]MDE2206094.1 valine--tRNA ligase [Armatimonadota bacterium]